MPDEIDEVARLLGIRTEDPTTVPTRREGRKFNAEQTMLCRLLTDSVRAAIQGDLDERAWLLSDEEDGGDGFSAVQVCEYLHLSHHRVRRALLRRIGGEG